MTQPVATIGELFPADDLIAQFVLTTSAQRNDLGEAVEQVVEHAQAEHNVVHYYHRLLGSHYFEAAKWLRHATDTVPEVSKWLDDHLSEERKENLEAVLATTSKNGLVKKVLWSGRGATFHYPRLQVEQQGLEDALKAIADRPAQMSAVFDDEGRPTPRADFAEELLSYFQLHTFGDDLEARVKEIQDAAIKYVHLADECLRTYMDERGHWLGDPQVRDLLSRPVDPHLGE